MMFPVYVLVLLLVGNAASLEFKPCEEGGMAPNSLYVFRCKEQPCEFATASNVTGAVNITVGEESLDLDGEVTVDHNGSLISFPAPGVHMCDMHLAGCRFESGDTANYYFMFHLNFDLPDTDLVTFKMVVRNEKGTPLACFEFEARVAGGAAEEDE